MKTALWFSVCMFGWGIAVFLMAAVTKGAGRLSLGTVLVCNLIGYAIAIAALARHVQLGWSWNHLLAILIAVLYVGANYSYYHLSQSGQQVTVLAPLTGLYVVVTVLLGVALLHEPVTLRKGLGIVLAVAAVILLTWKA
jgi:drug/metabolite transporter (DMT)-like permease